MIDELTILANKYASDKGTISPTEGNHGPRLHFTPVYHKYFGHLKNEKIKILEIGVGSGPSLKMWYDFFPFSEIHAIDVLSQKQHDNDRVKTYICDQSNRNQLINTIEMVGQFDIIIDDGSHVVSHQQISLGTLFPFLKSGGQYWVEDLHTSDESVWFGKNLYGYDMSFKKGESTVDVIEQYRKTSIFQSPFLNEMENKYLTENIFKCELFELPETFYGKNKLALFQKK